MTYLGNCLVFLSVDGVDSYIDIIHAARLYEQDTSQVQMSHLVLAAHPYSDKVRLWNVLVE